MSIDVAAANRLSDLAVQAARLRIRLEDLRDEELSLSWEHRTWLAASADVARKIAATNMKILFECSGYAAGGPVKEIYELAQLALSELGNSKEKQRARGEAERE